MTVADPEKREIAKMLRDHPRLRECRKLYNRLLTAFENFDGALSALPCDDNRLDPTMPDRDQYLIDAETVMWESAAWMVEQSKKECA
jgi:hypothetical protein